MLLFLHFWCIYRSISFGLQSSNGCVYFCTTGASTGFRSWSTIIQGMRLLVELWYMYGSIGPGRQSSLVLHCWCIYRFIGLGLQPSKGCVYYGIQGTLLFLHCCASIGLSVSAWPLGTVDLPHTVYIHFIEVFLPTPPVQFSVCKIQSIIIQGIAPFLSAPF